MCAETEIEAAKVKKGKWTPEEDALLRKGVQEAEQKGETPNFREITGKYLRRSSKQAKERWENSLNPDIKKGRWTREEELVLIDLMIQYGQNWAAIQGKMKTRALHCVKAKGRLLLGERLSLQIPQQSNDPFGNEKEWQSDELQALLILHQKYGYDYKTISATMGTGRSEAQLDRKILAHCNCYYCIVRNQEMRSPSDENANAIKSWWTKSRAKAIKESMIRKHDNGNALEYHTQNFMSHPGQLESHIGIKRKLGYDVSPTANGIVNVNLYNTPERFYSHFSPVKTESDIPTNLQQPLPFGTMLETVPPQVFQYPNMISTGAMPQGYYVVPQIVNLPVNGNTMVNGNVNLQAFDMLSSLPEGQRYSQYNLRAS